MAAFQDYKTAAVGNGSVIIKLSTASFFRGGGGRELRQG